jgi:hypothetical protein
VQPRLVQRNQHLPLRAHEQLAYLLPLRRGHGLPHVIAHESIHYQQNYPDDRSLLAASIKEGSADFLAEMISGRHINEHVHAWAEPRALGRSAAANAVSSNSLHSAALNSSGAPGRPRRSFTVR